MNKDFSLSLYRYGVISEQIYNLSNEIIEKFSEDSLSEKEIFENINENINLYLNDKKFTKSSNGKYTIFLELVDEANVNSNFLAELGKTEYQYKILKKNDNCGKIESFALSSQIDFYKYSNLDDVILLSLLETKNKFLIEEKISYLSSDNRKFVTLGFVEKSEYFGLFSVSDKLFLFPSQEIKEKYLSKDNIYVILDFFVVVPPQVGKLDVEFKLGNQVLNQSYLYSNKALLSNRLYFDFTDDRKLVMFELDKMKSDVLEINILNLKSLSDVNFSGDSRRISFGLRNIYLGCFND